MGQTESTQAIYIKQWDKVDSTRYSYLFHSNIDIYANQTHQLFALTVKNYDSDFHYFKELKRLDNYQQFQQIRGVIQILDIQQSEITQFCSKQYKIQTIYQYGQPITYENISWDSFFQQVVPILIQLKDKQFYHNDITLQSFVLIDNQLYLALPNNTQYIKMLTCSGKQTSSVYLCPELYSNLQKKQYNPQINKEKADVYSIGLVCLELCLKQPIQQIYQSDFTINQCMKIILQRSKMLIISKMLQLKQEDRPDFQQLFQANLYEQTLVTIQARISPTTLKSLQLKSRALQQSFNYPLTVKSQQTTREVVSSTNFEIHTPKVKSTKASYSNECFFLHDNIHIPVSPGENYLGSPPQKKYFSKPSLQKQNKSNSSNKKNGSKLSSKSKNKNKKYD